MSFEKNTTSLFSKTFRLIYLLFIIFIVLGILLSLLYGTRELLLPEKYRAMIKEEADLYQFDPLFIAAIIVIESHYRSTAVSPKGAIGLMQVKPSTITELERLKILTEQESALIDLKIPQMNIAIGTTYLNYMRDRLLSSESRKDKISNWFDNDPFEVMLHSYNAGPTLILNDILDSASTLKEYEGSIRERRSMTEKYAQDVLATYEKLKWINLIFPYYTK